MHTLFNIEGFLAAMFCWGLYNAALRAYRTYFDCYYAMLCLYARAELTYFSLFNTHLPIYFFFFFFFSYFTCFCLSLRDLVFDTISSARWLFRIVRSAVLFGFTEKLYCGVSWMGVNEGGDILRLLYDCLILLVPAVFCHFCLYVCQICVVS